MQRDEDGMQLTVKLATFSRNNEKQIAIVWEVNTWRTVEMHGG
jgi:hypothetical protein